MLTNNLFGRFECIIIILDFNIYNIFVQYPKVPIFFK